MNPKYIVVQAGGKGTRLQYLTRNKPKALVPVENLPMLFHLFRNYPESKYVIIGDYKYDVLEKYLAIFSTVDYQLVCATGRNGTCAGIQEAMMLLPENTDFMLVWSDLILPPDLDIPVDGKNYVGLGLGIPCRWKYENGVFEEKQSKTHGVAGMFVFCDKHLLDGVPYEGELVRWLSQQDIIFESLPICGIKEFGILSEYEKLGTSRCRPFNHTYVEDGCFVKEAIDAQGKELAKRESMWYRKIQDFEFHNIPQIISYNPLKMEYIDGCCVYEYKELSREEKISILRGIVSCLKRLQALESVPVDPKSYFEAYIGKTFDRLKKVQELVPFSKDRLITVNGRACRNVMYCRTELEHKVEAYLPDSFKLIHGDCTFSNIMLRDDNTPILLDPRGYFGHTELFGDPAYDWAKLYYSVVGNYDQFNRKRFRLEIGNNTVSISVQSNGWEEMEEEFFNLIGDEVTPRQIRLFHALIWLSLTTYAWEDYDSICGAFYNGIYYLEEALDETVL